MGKFFGGIFAFLVISGICIFFTVNAISGHQDVFEGETTGVITRITWHAGNPMGVYVTYTVNGVQHVSSLRNIMIYRRIREGQQIRIFYDPLEPWRIRTTPNYLGIFLLSLFVLLILFCLLLSIRKGWREMTDTEHLEFEVDHRTIESRILGKLGFESTPGRELFIGIAVAVIVLIFFEFI